MKNRRPRATMFFSYIYVFYTPAVSLTDSLGLYVLNRQDYTYIQCHLILISYCNFVIVTVWCMVPPLNCEYIYILAIIVYLEIFIPH